MLPPPIPVLQDCQLGKEYFVSCRSFADQPIFGSAAMCVQMKQLMRFYAQFRTRIGSVICSMPRVRIRAYCIVPESFALVIQPVVPGGVEYFISVVQEAVSAYYAVLFKSPKRVFEDIPVVTEIIDKTECMSAIRYIHSLPFSGDYVRDGDFHGYPWCSTYEIMNSDREGVMDDKLFEEYFPTIESYMDFIQSGKVSQM